LELCSFPVQMSNHSYSATPLWSDPCLDHSSPYHIHPSENPSSVSISLTQDGNNYHSLSRSLTMALISKNKMGFLTSTIPIPDVHHPSYPSWERCNTLVMSWLLNSLSPPLHKVSSSSTAQQTFGRISMNVFPRVILFAS